MNFGKEAENAARAHAVAEYPRESCGLIVAGAYVPCENVDPKPEEAFQIATSVYRRHAAKAEAVIHSHPSHYAPPFPSGADMAGQRDSGLPWGLVWTNGTEADKILWWGEFTLDEPLLERRWVPGVYDCYSLLRAWFWQERQGKLPEFPRDADWWQDGLDLFTEGFALAGAVEVAGPRLPGDVVLMQIRSSVPNHCAIVRENGLVLHHLAGRLSREDPLNTWERMIVKHLRYAG